MASEIKQAVPGWYWAVAVLLLLWSLAGCFAYLTQVSMSEAEMAALPKAQADIWRSMPAWATAAYAIAVWLGFAGAVGLLLRRHWARLAYLVSLVAVIVQFGWTFLATDIMTTVGPSAAVFPAFIIAVAAFSVWFAGFAIRRGWLR